MSASATVYKRVGSVLLQQEPEEAVANVAKRLEYIKGEMYGTGHPELGC